LNEETPKVPRRYCDCGISTYLFLFPLYGRYCEPFLRGYTIRQKLLSEIDQAKQIKVIEHSCRWDSPHPKSRTFHETVFSAIVLTSSQIADLRSALPLTADNSGHLATACIFVPDHRIEFVRENGTVFALEICFSCGEISLDNEPQRIFPDRWEVSLNRFVSSIGLNPNRQIEKRSQPDEMAGNVGS
jgi:hypothetical protein